MKLFERLSLSILVVLVIGTLSGCQVGRGVFIPGVREHYEFEQLAKHRPKNRMGTVASSGVITAYHGSSNLGRHSYNPNGSEQNGMIYTCRGGHIDLAHLRNVADWTGYLASRSFGHIKKGDAGFSFTISEEARCFVEIDYPFGWEELSDESKESIAKNISFGLGEYFAYQFSVWHEIATWFGYKSSGIYPEFVSAFSWEDTYSNLLGGRIGHVALKNKGHCFSDAVTIALNEEMDRLGIESLKIAKEAARQMRSNNCKDMVSTANIRSRNFDVGLGDGYITPWTIPGIGKCDNVTAQSYRVPDLDFLDRYGFAVKLKIEPKVWEKHRIFRIVFGNRYKKTRFLDPSEQFGKVMAYIEREAIEMYGLLSNSGASN